MNVFRRRAGGPESTPSQPVPCVGAVKLSAAQG